MISKNQKSICFHFRMDTNCKSLSWHKGSSGHHDILPQTVNPGPIIIHTSWFSETMCSLYHETWLSWIGHIGNLINGLKGTTYNWLYSGSQCFLTYLQWNWSFFHVINNQYRYIFNTCIWPIHIIKHMNFMISDKVVELHKPWNMTLVDKRWFVVARELSMVIRRLAWRSGVWLKLLGHVTYHLTIYTFI